MPTSRRNQGRLVPCLLLAAAATVCGADLAAAQQVAVPNSSFELGARRPEGWSLSGGAGEWTAGEAPNGRRTVRVTGTGDDTNYWRSQPLSLAPGELYELSFMVRSQASAGTPVTGPVFCNRDLETIGSQWQEFRSVFVAPAAMAPGRSWLRFGQWHANGSIDYDRIELRRAQPVYAAAGGTPLGDGERLDGDTYTCLGPGSARGGNHNRALAGHNCDFNTYRWCFGSGSFVAYRHALTGRRQLAAEISVSMGYHEQGSLLVEASADSAAWTAVGRLDSSGTGRFAVPAGLLPAERVWVRLQAEAGRGLGADSDPGAFQVTDYCYTARVDGPPVTARGSTQYLAIDAADDALAATVLGLGEAVPGGDNRVRVALTNRSTAARTAQLAVSVAGADAQYSGLSDARTIAPQVTDTLTAAYGLPGAGTWDVDIELRRGGDLRCRATAELAPLFETAYGERLPDSTGTFGLWWAASGWKVAARRPLPERTGYAVRLAAARGETEAAQLVLRPDADLQQLTVTATALEGPGGARLPAEQVDLLRVGYVAVERPSDPSGAAAPWPDPLLPLTGAITVAAKTNQPLWVRVRVPREAAPGLYRGELVLQTATARARVPLQVTVFGFALPQRLTCSTAFGFSWDDVLRYQRLKTEADQRLVLGKYLANFAAHHVSPYDPAPMDPLRVGWDGLVPRFDWTAWDAAVSRGLDTLGFNSMLLDVEGLGGGTFFDRQAPELNGRQEATAEYDTMLAAYLGGLEQHLREKGWLDEAYVYWFDEPEPRDYEFVLNGFGKLSRHAPALRRMLTEQVEPELVGGPNIWCPVTSSFAPEPAAARQREGETIWWYVCTGPKAPYAGLFIDHAGTEMRVWLWQTWQQRVQGVLVWDTNYWTSPAAYPGALQDPYVDPMSWVSGYGTEAGARMPWGNGDGRFLYPPLAAVDSTASGPVLDGPVETIRWEMLRDGLEDYEYFVILRRLLDNNAQLPARLRQRYQRLLEVPAAVSTSMTQFTRDPGTLEAHRQALAEAIEALSR